MAATTRKKKKLAVRPNLQFLQSTDKVGFTSAGVTSFSKASTPAAIVRELIQNALDASQAAENSKAVIRFRLGTIKTEDIPGIASYRKALKEAKSYREQESGGKLTNQEQMIVERMEGALKKVEQHLLAVIDNGIGLTKNTMRALLADGISEKPGRSGGAFGNGHFAVFPISDLRYLLYAGVNNSSRIASGHAILASQPKRSANGYYISGANDVGRHCYPTEESIPKAFRWVLEDIESKDGHGTAVLVPAFNNFRGNKATLYSAVAEAATCNFFPAIEQNKLAVILEHNDAGVNIEQINSKNLQQTLSTFSENKRNKDFLSGYKASMSYRAMKEGERHEVPNRILGGRVDIHLQTPSPDGRACTNLFRNGMWITNSDKQTGGLPCFYNAFGDHQSFEAVVLVTADGAPKFHDLIRNAETPLHNQLDLQSMPDDDRKTLRECFKLLRDRIAEKVPEISKEGYRPPHLLGVIEEINGSGSSRNAGWHYSGSITAMTRNYRGQGPTRKGTTTGPGRGGKGGGGKGSKSARKVLPNAFDVVARPDRKNKNKKRICIHSYEDCGDMLLRLTVDENNDATTDDLVWQQHEARIVCVAPLAMPGDNDIAERIKCVEQPHSGVWISNLKAGESITFDVEYTLDEIARYSLSSPSLRVKLELATADKDVIK